MKNQDLIYRIKEKVKTQAPNATVILYGSYARGDNTDQSDVDLLILLEKEKVTRADEMRVTYPLYDIEFDTGTMISPLVYAKKDWETRHKITPFYENVKRDGRVL
jgi:uncharacterized protein